MRLNAVASLPNTVKFKMYTAIYEAINAMNQGVLSAFNLSLKMNTAARMMAKMFIIPPTAAPSIIKLTAKNVEPISCINITVR